MISSTQVTKNKEFLMLVAEKRDYAPEWHFQHVTLPECVKCCCEFSQDRMGGRGVEGREQDVDRKEGGRWTG